jgi:hypothetical protein
VRGTSIHAYDGDNLVEETNPSGWWGMGVIVSAGAGWGLSPSMAAGSIKWGSLCGQSQLELLVFSVAKFIQPRPTQVLGSRRVGRSRRGRVCDQC